MSSHPIITSVELVSLVVSHGVEFYIKFIPKKHYCAEKDKKLSRTPKSACQEVSNAIKNNKLSHTKPQRFLN